MKITIGKRMATIDGLPLSHVAGFLKLLYCFQYFSTMFGRPDIFKNFGNPPIWIN